MFRVCIYAYIYIYMQGLGSRVVHIHTCIHAHTHKFIYTLVNIKFSKYLHIYSYTMSPPAHGPPQTLGLLLGGLGLKDEGLVWIGWVYGGPIVIL